MPLFDNLCIVFKVVVTPTRQRQAQKMSAAREPSTATMAPFSAKSIIAFEDIPVTKTARRFLNICNPYSEVLKVSNFLDSFSLLNQ